VNLVGRSDGAGCPYQQRPWAWLAQNKKDGKEERFVGVRKFTFILEIASFFERNSPQISPMSHLFAKRGSDDPNMPGKRREGEGKLPKS
jgi:hypothetical protein